MILVANTAPDPLGRSSIPDGPGQRPAGHRVRPAAQDIPVGSARAGGIIATQLHPVGCGRPVRRASASGGKGAVASRVTFGIDGARVWTDRPALAEHI